MSNQHHMLVLEPTTSWITPRSGLSPSPYVSTNLGPQNHYNFLQQYNVKNVQPTPSAGIRTHDLLNNHQIKALALREVHSCATKP